jgi:hypothetical protein
MKKKITTTETHPKMLSKCSEKYLRYYPLTKKFLSQGRMSQTRATVVKTPVIRANMKRPFSKREWQGKIAEPVRSVREEKKKIKETAKSVLFQGRFS